MVRLEASMSIKVADRIRCDECGTNNEIWIPPTVGGDNVIWCCRSCGSELTRSVVPPEPHSLKATILGAASDTGVQRVH